MRLLFAAFAAHGHLNPLLPLALAARAAGHTVEFATAAVVHRDVGRYGFVCHDAGLSFPEAVAELAALPPLPEPAVPRDADGRPDLIAGARLFCEVIARRKARDVSRLLERTKPDVVVYDHYDFGAAVAAHLADIPVICHAVSPRPDGAMRASLGGFLEQLWEYCGADRVDLDVLTGDAYVDPLPTVLQDPSTLAGAERVAVRPVPVSMPGTVVPEWLASSTRPLVYLTLGTVVADDAGLRPAIAALASLDVEVLVALGSAAGEELGPTPARVHVHGMVDQPAVLERADLVVHHGGSGTLTAALAAGVPQVVLPRGADQFVNADRMAAAGLATVLEPAAATPERIAAAAVAEFGARRPAYEQVRAELAARPSPEAVLADLLSRFG